MRHDAALDYGVLQQRTDLGQLGSAGCCSAEGAEGKQADSNVWVASTGALQLLIGASKL
jgi:hypothetical protein